MERAGENGHMGNWQGFSYHKGSVEDFQCVWEGGGVEQMVTVHDSGSVTSK